MAQSDRIEQRDPDFSREALARQTGFFRELWSFMIVNKKWWLAPMLIAALLLGTLVMLGSTAAAPFVYTLF